MIKQILRDVKNYIKQKQFNDKWRKFNTHNRTTAETIYPIDKVCVGKYTYGKLNVHYYNRDNEYLKIGAFCSIADNVHFFTGGNHDYTNISTYPFKNIFTNNKIQEASSKGKIEIGDDVWIGYGSIILSGVTIGQGAIVGAGSVVSKDVPPYSIFVGNKVIKYRFSDEIISKLLQVDFNKIDEKTFTNKFEPLYAKITNESVYEIIRKVVE